MKLWQEDDTTVDVVWYRAPPGAKHVPYFTPFRSRNYVDPKEVHDGLGEERPYEPDPCCPQGQPWYSGNNPYGFLGKGWCGSEGAWTRGGIHGVDPELEVIDGVPVCCGPTAYVATGDLGIGSVPVVVWVVSGQVFWNMGPMFQQRIEVPSGVIGDLLVTVCAGPFPAVPIVWPTGWTEIMQAGAFPDQAYRWGAAYRFADQAEGEVIDWTESEAQFLTGYCARFRYADVPFSTADAIIPVGVSGSWPVAALPFPTPSLALFNSMSYNIQPVIDAEYPVGSIEVSGLAGFGGTRGRMLPLLVAFDTGTHSAGTPTVVSWTAFVITIPTAP